MNPAPLAPILQRLLLLAGGLVILAGIQLFVLADPTETLFAWTVYPPLTAAFFGALYWSAAVLEILAARGSTWANARIALPGVLAFTVLTNGPTWSNLDQYHLDSPTSWVWIATYVVVPFLFLGGLRSQKTLGWQATPRTHPLPRPLQGVLGLAGLGLGLGGLVLLIVPEQAGAAWPWDLSPQVGSYSRFTEPYMGCWGVGLGLVAGQAAWENDRIRLRPLWPAMLTTSVLCATALLRYKDAVSWRHPATEILVAVLALLAGTALWGLWLGRSPETRSVPS